MNDIKLKKIQNYLNNLFETEHFVLKKRKNIEDSLEIYIKDEFLDGDDWMEEVAESGIPNEATSNSVGKLILSGFL